MIKSETYTSDATNIPQVAAPVGINLWCFKQTPAQDQAVVIRKFEFVMAGGNPVPISHSAMDASDHY
jgi:hypothetical protein